MEMVCANLDQKCCQCCKQRLEIDYNLKRDLGSKITPEQRAQGLAECKVFKEWITEHVLTFNAEGKGESVMLLPLGNAIPDYRDIVVGSVS